MTFSRLIIVALVGSIKTYLLPHSTYTVRGNTGQFHTRSFHAHYRTHAPYSLISDQPDSSPDFWTQTRHHICAHTRLTRAFKSEYTTHPPTTTTSHNNQGACPIDLSFFSALVSLSPASGRRLKELQINQVFFLSLSLSLPLLFVSLPAPNKDHSLNTTLSICVPT